MNLLARFATAGLAALLALAPVWGSAQAAAPADDIKRGEYLATAGDCVACHTAPGGKAFAGGLEVATPLGAIVSTNISPSPDGIGAYRFEDFDRAVRKGIRKDGAHLYPAMPYTSYALVTEADMRALYAYFMQGVPPVAGKPAPTRLPFPFNLRASMAGWNLLFLDDKPFRPEPGKDSQWNRGAYLVRGLTHCGTCHTPRNLAMAEDGSRPLAGAELGNWYAPNITADPVSGIGGWSDAEITTYLRLGHVPGKAQAAGPMAEAIDYSLSHLTAEDLQAITTYLRSVPAHAEHGVSTPAYAIGKASDRLAEIRGVALPENPDAMNGPQLYDAYCATCHQSQAQGSFDGRLPSLFHNTATGSAHPQNLVMVIMEGIQRGPQHDEVLMPAFGHALSDTQIATLSNFLRSQYGSGGSELSAADIGQLRQGGPRSHLVLVARIAMAVVTVLIMAALVWLVRGRRRRSGKPVRKDSL